jgi:hypothetical protein
VTFFDVNSRADHRREHLRDCRVAHPSRTDHDNPKLFMLAWVPHPLRGFWAIAQRVGTFPHLRHIYQSAGSLNRITVATEGPFSGSVGRWEQSFTLDPWGNTKQNVVRGNIPAFQQNASDANRPDQTGSGFTYDAAGNLQAETGTPSKSYTWDAESRLTAFSGPGGSDTYT